MNYIHDQCVLHVLRTSKELHPELKHAVHFQSKYSLLYFQYNFLWDQLAMSNVLKNNLSIGQYQI